MFVAVSESVDGDHFRVVLGLALLHHHANSGIPATGDME